MRNAELEALCKKKADSFKAVRGLLRLGRKRNMEFGALWDCTSFDVFLLVSDIHKLLPADLDIPIEATFEDLVNWVVANGFNDELAEVSLAREVQDGVVDYFLVYHDNLQAGFGYQDRVRIKLN